MADEADKRDLMAGVALSEFDATALIEGKLGAEDVLLAKGASGYFAIGARCTHSGAPLVKGLLVGDTLRCPWHHACFDLPSGASVAAPALDRLARWAVEQRDGRVFVTTAKPGPARPRRATAERIVIVGAGAGGLAAADALAAMGAGDAVTLIGNELDVAYDRTALSKHYLAGTLDEDGLGLRLASLTDRGVAVRLGAMVVAIERDHKLIRLEDGSALPYTKLILATGGEPHPPTVPGGELPHVHLLRSADDARRLLGSVATARAAVVIGGSFIGLESAAALRDRRIEVTVVSRDEHPLRQVLGPELSDAILAVHRRQGTHLRLGTEVARIAPDAVILKDGTSLPADLVLVGIGIAPRVHLADHAGLERDDGIVVDERLRTSDPDIFAVGDIARWPDPHSGRAIRVEHWAVAQRQGQVAAMNALGGQQPYNVVPFFWTMHFDFSVRYVGHAGKGAETLLAGDLSSKDASVRFFENGREVAVATVDRDRACLEAELAMKHRHGVPAAHLPAPPPD